MLTMLDSLFTIVHIEVCVGVTALLPQIVENLRDSAMNVGVMVSKIGDISLVEVVLLPEIGLASKDVIDATVGKGLDCGIGRTLRLQGIRD